MSSLQFHSFTDTEKLVEFSDGLACFELDSLQAIVPTIELSNSSRQNPALRQHQCQWQPWQLSKLIHPKLIHLNFCQLKSFTLVRDQYQPWGIQFSGAIALQPSNFAFTNQEQPIGLMPMLDRAPLVIQFEQPRQLVKIDLVGAKQIIVRVFNRTNQCVGEQHLGQPSFLASGHSDAPVHYEAQLWATEITRVEMVSEAAFLMHRLICG
jgi:hypothetical protein